MKKIQLGFFDTENRYERLTQLGDPLEKLNGAIDLEMFRGKLTAVCQKEDYTKGGRPPIDVIIKFKASVLRRIYNLSFDQTEYQINDRLSFMRFLGIGLGDKVLDSRTLWNFENTLAESEVMEELFCIFDAMLESEGLITHKGTIIDATFVDAPKQRNSRDDNKTIKSGNIPEEWKKPERAAKLAQKDTDARWTKKGNETHFGYKDHVKCDAESKLITNYSVTDAAVHDSQCCTDLLEESDEVFYADRAYAGDDIAQNLPDGCENQICEKGTRNHPLTDEQKESNRKKSKIRCRIEHIFGFMTNSMHGITIRSIGIYRAWFNIGLTNLIYNFFITLKGNYSMWKTVQCAVQGKSHVKDNIPCQDKTFSLSQNGVHVIALADGAGSAKLSHFGAECVTTFICHELTDNFEKFFNAEDGVAVKKELMSKIWLSLDEIARKYSSNIQEFASTLMFVAVKENKFIISHIGDGVIGYMENDELKIASEPDNGEFANTTVFTTSKQAILSMRLIKGELKNISGFILMSDGTSAALYNKHKKQLSSGIAKIMRLCNYVPSETIDKMLENSFTDTIKQVTTDDCSICIMSITDPKKGYCNLNLQDKAKLLEINGSKYLKKQIHRYDTILISLTIPQDLKAISKIIHLKPKYTRKYIRKLEILNFIECSKGKYHSIIEI